METHKLSRLQSEHHKLEERLAAELARPRPNDFLVREIRQRKTQVRHQIFEAECGPIR